MKDDLHNDPSNWKFGIFYFNPEDKRLFLPKRIPSMGMTVNFANPYSFLVMAALAACIIIAGRALP
jgi:uncharacterized membrane protein